MSQRTDQRCTPVTLRRWLAPLPLPEFDYASVSPDNTLLVLQNSRKNLVAVYDLKADAKFTPARISWPSTSLHWLNTNTHTFLVTTSNDSLDLLAVTVTSSLPLYLRELKAVPVPESNTPELFRIDQQPNFIVQYTLPFSHINTKISQKMPELKYQKFDILGTTNNNEIIATLDRQYVLVLHLTETMALKIQRIITLPEIEQRTDQLWLKHNWVCFYQHPNIALWDVSGEIKAQFPIGNTLQSSNASEPHRITHFDISSDFQDLAIVDEDANLIVFDLNLLRQDPAATCDRARDAFSFHDEESHADDDVEETTDWRSYFESDSVKKSKSFEMTQWFEYDLRSKACNISPSWTPKPVGVLPSNGEEPDPLNSINGFNFKQVKGPNSETDTGADAGPERHPIGLKGMVSLYRFRSSNQSIGPIVVSPKQILVTTVSENDRMNGVIFCSRSDIESLNEFTLENESLLLLEMSHYLSLPYYLTCDGLRTVVTGKRESLTDGIIIFHGPSQAESLYAINDWDCRSLRLHTLGMGLRFRQMDVVVPALQTLDHDQEYLGAQMLLDYFLSNEMAIQDQFFLEQVLKLSMEFVAQAIVRKVQQLASDNTKGTPPFIGYQFTMTELLDSVGSFSHILQSLQKCKLELIGRNKPKSKKAPKKHSLPSGRWLELNLIKQQKLLADRRTSGQSTSDFDDSLTELREDDSFLTQEQPKKSDNESDEASSLGSPTQTAFSWELAEDRISNLDEFALSFGTYRDVWEKMSHLQIVRHAISSRRNLLGDKKDEALSPRAANITTSNVSMALSYLRWRAEKRHTEEQFFLDLDWFKEISFKLIYQEVLKADLEVAALMINNVGENIVDHFTEIAWKTTRRSTREALIQFLRQKKALNESQNKTIHYANLIQDFYPNWDYDSEFLQLNPGATLPAASDFPCHDLDDMDQKVRETLGFEVSHQSAKIQTPERIKEKTRFTASGRESVISLNPVSLPSKIGRGYGHLRLRWIDAWTPDMLCRALFESCINNGYDLQRVETLIGDSGSHFLTQIEYNVTHNDWNRLIQWVDKINVEGLSLDKYGKINENSDPTGSSSKHLQPLLSAIKSQFKFCTPLVSEILRNKLAQRGFFFDINEILSEEPEEWIEISSEIKAPKSFESLLRTLATVDRLFSPMSATTHCSLPLKELMPSGALSPFHVYFIRFCTQNRLLAVLELYLETHNLAKTTEQVLELRRCLGTSNGLEVNWTEIMLLFRAHEDIFTLALMNCQLCLVAGDHSSSRKEGKLMSTSDIFELSLQDKGEHSELMVLSTLMYSPTGFEGCLQNTASGTLHYVSIDLLKRAVAEYPLLQETLFPNPNNSSPLLSAKSVRSNERQCDILPTLQDINLCQLLYGCSPFTLDTIFKSPKKKEKSLSFPSFSGSEFASDRYTDVIDTKYYLTNGQPFHAFDFITSDRSEPGLHWSNQEILTMLNIARSTAFAHIFEDSTLSSCIAFLELCGIDPLGLRVDIAAFKRVLLFKKLKINAGHMGNAFSLKEKKLEEKQAANEVIEIFMEAAELQGDHPKLIALFELLKQALKEKALDSTPLLAKDELSKNKWKLLSFFTSTHKMTQDFTLLKVLAKHNDWIAFLSEAHELGCPLPKIYALANHFTKSTLKEHILLCLKQTEPSCNLQTDQKPSDHIFTLVASAQNESSPGHSLLSSALTLKRPFLAVLASSLEEIASIEAFNVYLHSSLSDNEWTGQDIQYEVLATGVSLTQTPNGPIFVPSISTSQKYHSVHALNDFQTIFSILLKKGAFIHLLNGFDLFFPSHILLDWIKFEQHFSRYSFEKAEAHISALIKNLRSPDFPIVFKFGDLEWTETLVLHLSDRMLLRLPTVYEKLQFLRILANCQFSSRHIKLSKLYQLLQSVELTDHIPITNLVPEASSVIHLLISKQLYAEARSYAKETNANRSYFDEITIAQVENQIATRPTSPEHLTEKPELFWSEANETFVRESCTPLRVGQFYLKQEKALEGTEPTLEDAEQAFKSKKKTAQERITLLKLAIDWLNGSYDDQLKIPPDESSSKKASLSSSVDKQSPAFLASLDEKILGISVELQIESLKNDPNFDPKLYSPQPKHITHTNRPQEPLIKTEAQPRTRRNLLSDFENPDITWLDPQPEPDTRLHDSEDKNPVDEPNVLDVVIGRLLNQGNLVEAGRVTKQFSHTSHEYEIITNMRHLADGSLAIQFLNEKLFSDDNIDVSRLDKQDILTILANKCIIAREYAHQILVRFKVAQLLTQPFETLDQRDPYDVLQFLLLQGYEKCQLIKEFISYSRLDPTRVAIVLANHCLKSILEGPGLCDDQTKAFIVNALEVPLATKPNAKAPVIQDSSESDTDTEISSASPEASPSPVKNALSMPTKTPIKTPISSRLAKISTPGRIEQIMATPSTPIRDHLSSWSANSNGTIGTTTTEFIDFISLSENPEQVGEQLLQRLAPIIQRNNSSAYGFEVEILVHSHFCFLVATNVNGVDRVLDLITKRVEYYVAKREFKLLVRLLTGTKEYSRLEQLLHLLTAHDCFEMMLSKHVVMNEEGKRELKLALFHFLKTHYPDDTPKMKLVFLRFGMFREYAQLIQEKAMAKLALLNQIKTFSPSLFPLLLEIMERLLDAAENYQKARALKHALQCYEQAELLALQLEQPDIPFINLTTTQVRQLMAFGGVFQHSYVLSCAYGLNELSEWITPVYNQVIEAGNFEYFSDFSQRIRFGDDLFIEIIRKWKTSTSRKTSHVAHLKRFLTYIDDFQTRYQAAVSLGAPFKSVVTEIEAAIPWANLGEDS